MHSTFVFLTLAIVLLWRTDQVTVSTVKYAWLMAFVVAIVLGIDGGELEAASLLSVLLFAAVCYSFTRLTGILKLVAGIGIILFSLALGLHILPGFNNPQIVAHVHLGTDSRPYNLYFNFDKALIGLFILYWLHPLHTDVREFVVMLKKIWPASIVTIVAVIVLSYLVGYIRFDPKVPGFIGYWLWANLFFTCIAEEALFRGFLQRQLAFMLSGQKHGAILALAVCAILFGLAHAGGGAQYVFLATVAGLGYGWVYHRTQRIELSILLHFALNSIHIFLFSYPALLQ